MKKWTDLKKRPNDSLVSIYRDEIQDTRLVVEKLFEEKY